MTNIRFKNIPERQKHTNCETYYEIVYKTPYSTGLIKVKTSIYQDYIKKFDKVFKDVSIVSFKELREGELA